MCDSCPECYACGQPVHQPAGLNYIAGLLAPIAVIFLAVEIAHRLQYLPSELYWIWLGALFMGAWTILYTDRHRFVLQLSSPAAEEE